MQRITVSWKACLLRPRLAPNHELHEQGHFPASASSIDWWIKLIIVCLPAWELSREETEEPTFHILSITTQQRNQIRSEWGWGMFSEEYWWIVGKFWSKFKKKLKLSIILTNFHHNRTHSSQALPAIRNQRFVNRARVHGTKCHLERGSSVRLVQRLPTVLAGWVESQQ